MVTRVIHEHISGAIQANVADTVSESISVESLSEEVKIDQDLLRAVQGLIATIVGSEEKAYI